MTDAAPPLAELSFEAEVIHWRGPAPWFFAPLPPDAAAEVRRVARAASYGWGVIPAEASLSGGQAFTTSLFPRDDTYLLPIKAKVRQAAAVTAGDKVSVRMTIRAPASPRGFGPI